MKKFIITLFVGVFSFSVFATNPVINSFLPKEKVADQKKDTIHIVGHAHMDMNWLWTYSETMKMCNDNLRQTVAFMEEFPDFTFIQSQAAVYNFVEKVDPPLFKLVQKYVKEGRLELAGGMWTEGDGNLSSGEAIARSFLLGQSYFQSRFGKMAHVGWLPDNFGHVSQLPQMLKLSGSDYFYFHRTNPYMGSFWWIGSDSSKVLCYANETYNGAITPDLKDKLKIIAPDKHRILHITGVGDHGGGPTRANINMIHELDEKTDYPAVKFTTAGNFFSKVSNEMDGRPTHRGEMQFVFEGCYTTVADIKEGNRNCENSLYSNEFFNTLRWINGDKYPADEIRDLWETVTFNQFHDILPGSAIYEANREAVARYSEVLRQSKELRDKAFWKMADEVKFKKDLGQPVVAYNQYPVNRKTIVEANVYSHEEPYSVSVAHWGANYYGKNFSVKDEVKSGVATVLVRDGTGKTYPAQIVYSKMTPPGYTSKVQFIDDDFPAGGYKTFYVDMTKPGEFNDAVPVNENSYETDFFKVKFNMSTGAIISLVDKQSGHEYVKEGGELNKLRIYQEDKKGGMKSWTINKIVKQEDVTNIESVKVIENGPVRVCIETVKTWGKSRFIERVYLYRSYPRITYDMEVHWLETGSDSTDSPMLRAIFPLAVDNPKFFCQTPFDVVERAVDGKINGKDVSYPFSQSTIYGVTPEKNDGQEVPAQKWVDLSNENAGIALLNNSKYGHSYHNGELRLTLMRAAGNPDIYPNLGKFKISYALFPHSGDWKNGVWQEGDDFNVPVYAAEPPSLALVSEHSTRPEEESFISLEGSGVYMTGMKQSEDTEELIIRLVEVEGDEKTITLSLPKNIEAARRLNIIEFPLSGVAETTIKDNVVTVKIKPHEIITLGIKLKK